MSFKQSSTLHKIIVYIAVLGNVCYLLPENYNMFSYKSVTWWFSLKHNSWVLKFSWLTPGSRMQLVLLRLCPLFLEEHPIPHSVVQVKTDSLSCSLAKKEHSGYLKISDAVHYGVVPTVSWITTFSFFLMRSHSTICPLPQL